MGNLPVKPTGDITRPAPTTTRRSAMPGATSLQPSHTPAPQAAPTLIPRSSANIPSLAPGEREAKLPDGGQPLNTALRSHFGARLNADFSEVRIHTDERAAQAAESIQAEAYTVGEHIVFGADRFEPHTTDGQHLLAHELAHVAQPAAQSARGLSRTGDASEREADTIADTVMRGGSATPQAAATAAVQREPKADVQPPKSKSVLNQMLDTASPFLAASIGSTTVSGFDTGKSDLEPAQLPALQNAAQNITGLLAQYPQSTVEVIGHTDTVGTEARNLALGQARADAAAAVLEKFGVPAAIVTTTSLGEATPQAAKTKDETPNAQNRRVEVRFQPNAARNIAPLPQPELEAPKLQDSSAPPPAPPVDLTYHPPLDQDYRGPPYRPDYYKPLPPAPKGTAPKSLLDMVGDKIIDPVVDRVAHKFSSGVRQKIKEAARNAVATGVAKGARLAAEAAGVTDAQALDAIENATQAAIQEKGQSPP